MSPVIKYLDKTVNGAAPLRRQTISSYSPMMPEKLESKGGPYETTIAAIAAAGPAEHKRPAREDNWPLNTRRKARHNLGQAHYELHTAAEGRNGGSFFSSHYGGMMTFATGNE
ncbi:hypothetical protein MPTK1_6g08020 [Marchantia polymorpha subsp. ruderalis]|uniref:Uncharacterized protein n=2 Tax=Marchantia polymorpha TaxID=3197 RepID=A0AAF6BPR0_MARPO|nr:hypothetical protein MARPO_0239s0007 [Marchantia polymorpha]BBN13994.1 hypothetical protein Mp_6g08020 [Marchantia polymorpha subsp. ruderalis]|eukprot:PTQ27030.1 hypothetical protein MARPO_0239s0007 [Marchantia polymorpha]